MTEFPTQFTRDDLIQGLNELGAATARAGKIIDLAIYGGSCLMLVSNFRVSSQDVDAVAQVDQPFIDAIARQIAIRRSWPEDWLNDGVRTYLSPNVDVPEHHELFATYPSESNPGLRVYVPTPQYMLAMKLMSLRIDDAQDNKDKDDVESLLLVVGVQSKQQLIDLAAAYYPEARVSGKLLLAADHLLAAAKSRDSHESPRYSARRGQGLAT